MNHTENWIGSQYKKVVYREYTDGEFVEIKARPPREEHLELLGKAQALGCTWVLVDMCKQCSHARGCSHVRMHTCTHTFMDTLAHAHIHAYTHTHTSTCISTFTHKHAFTPTHTHMCV